MLSVLSIGYLIAQQEELRLYKETEQFKLFCTPVDDTVANEMLQTEEMFFNKLTKEFDHIYSKQVLIYIYPDLKTFHEAINWPDAPDWVIGNTTKDERMTVSPRNPGPAHTYDSVMRSNINGLVMLYINDKYKNHDAIPRWLCQGVSLYKAHFYSSENIAHKLTQNTLALPTLEQLESVDKNNTLAFDKLNGFKASFSMVQFIDQKWGWRSILALLEDYSKFEEIVGLTKDEFRDQWISFLKENHE
jgi:RNA polymerase sigma-70 factor (ECF subfamily)